MLKIAVSGIEHLWELSREAHKTGRDKMVLCPAHDDKTPSLSIGSGNDGRILLTCQAGCKTPDICSALGVKMSDLFMDNHKGNHTDTVYDYKDASGKLLYQVCKFPNKKFVQRRPGNNGDYIWDLKGVSRLLYKLPELNAADKKRYVFVSEGEKDCDRLMSLGLIATCNSGGAGNWQPEISEPLRDRRVVIIADHDEAGRKHSRAVAKILDGIASEIKIIEFENPKEGFDVSDFLNNGGTVQRIKGIVSKAKPFDSSLAEITNEEKDKKYSILHRTLKKDTQQKIEWLLPEIIPLGMLTFLVSQEGVGKSILVSSIIAHVSQGIPFPTSPHIPNPKSHVIIFAQEDPLNITLLPRLENNGADTDFVVYTEDSENNDGDIRTFDFGQNIEELSELLDEYPDTKLVVFDPITDYTSCMENSNFEVRKALRPLVLLAAERNIAILCLSHLSKKVDLGMINRTIGSRAWSAVPRMIWGIIKEENKDEEGNKISEDNGNRYLLNIKCNVAKKPEGVKFHIGEGAFVTWETERVDMSIDQNHKLKASRVEETAEWLTEFLGNENMTSAAIFESGEKAGFSRTLLYRAKDKLKIKASKLGWGNTGQWVWKLPDNDNTQTE